MPKLIRKKVERQQEKRILKSCLPALWPNNSLGTFNFLLTLIAEVFWHVGL